MSPNAAIEFPALRDPRYPVHRIASDLEPYLRAIVARIRPDQIVLFGSQAYGDPTEHSDVDLLVVRREMANMLESNLEIRRALREVDAPPMSFTLVSATPALVERKLAMHDFLFEDIFRQGVRLYAA